MQVPVRTCQRPASRDAAATPCTICRQHRARWRRSQDSPVLLCSCCSCSRLCGSSCVPLQQTSADSNAAPALSAGTTAVAMSASSLDNRPGPTREAGDGDAPPSAQPSSAIRVPRRAFFDPWNSSSTGHQRAENRLSGSTSWRASRSSKLGEQYKAGLSGGGKRFADTVGAGSPDFGKDGRKENGGWERGAKGLRMGGQRSLTEVWRATKAGERAVVDKTSVHEAHGFDDAQGTSPAKRLHG